MSAASSICAVCQSPSGGIFFGVPACRPCASFFRRSTAEGRQFVCRFEENCPIKNDGMRNCCRACRLRLCFESGMRTADLAVPMDDDGKNNNGNCVVQNISEEITNLALQPTTSGNIASLSFSLATPLATKLAQSYRQVLDGQQAITVQKYGLGIVLGHAVHLITHEEEHTLYRMCSPLLIQFVHSQFADFQSLTNQQKADFFKDYSMPFGFFHSAEMTVNTFTEDSSKFLIFPGCAIDVDNYQHFCRTMSGLGIDQQHKLVRPVLVRFLNLLWKVYKPLAISRLEFATLLGIALWNCVGQTVNFGQHNKEALYGELHALSIARAIERNEPSNSVPIRFGQLLSLLTDFSIVERELREYFTITKVLLDPGNFMHFSEVWADIFGVKDK